MYCIVLGILSVMFEAAVFFHWIYSSTRLGPYQLYKLSIYKWGYTSTYRGYNPSNPFIFRHFIGSPCHSIHNWQGPTLYPRWCLHQRVRCFTRAVFSAKGKSTQSFHAQMPQLFLSIKAERSIVRYRNLNHCWTVERTKWIKTKHPVFSFFYIDGWIFFTMSK